MAWMVTGPRLSGHSMGVGQHPVLDHQKPSFERGIGGPCSYKQVTICTKLFTIASLDGCTQFPPTIGQPERLAAGYWGGQVEIHHKVWLSI